MPKIRHFFFAFVLGIACIIVYAIFSMGLFKPVTVSQVEAGPFRLLYKDHVGPYHKITPIIAAVEAFAKENEIDCSRSFGLYMDDPAVVDQARMRSRGGCVLKDDQALPSQLPEGIQLQDVVRGPFLQGNFDGSPRIGPVRVYPKLLSEIEEKGLNAAKWGVMEIYEISVDAIKTTYLFPLEN